MKATMKQMVADSRVGIIRTPNQPTYRRLSVLVTHSHSAAREADRVLQLRVDGLFEESLAAN